MSNIRLVIVPTVVCISSVLASGKECVEFAVDKTLARCCPAGTFTVQGVFRLRTGNSCRYHNYLTENCLHKIRWKWRDED